MRTEQYIEQRLALMSDVEREHFKMVVLKIIKCYGSDADEAIVLLRDNGVGSILTINCDEMRVLEMLSEANELFVHLNTVDAPPKEAFN